jgi:hypothetical protein
MKSLKHMYVKSRSNDCRSNKCRSNDCRSIECRGNDIIPFYYVWINHSIKWIVKHKYPYHTCVLGLSFVQRNTPTVITPTLITPTIITPTLNTSTVTDSLCNSGAFSNPNTTYGTAHLTWKVHGFYPRDGIFFSYAALVAGSTGLFNKPNSVRIWCNGR